MARKSTITRLPLEIKAYIEAMLATGGQTLDELITDLRERFPAQAHAGDLPSRSAIGRYGQKLERRLSAIRASTEAAKLIQAQAGDDQDARSEAVIALVQTEMFDSIIAIQEAGDEETSSEDRLALMSKAAKNIATLTRASIAQKQYKATVVAKAQAAADTVDKLAKKGGLTAETAAQIRREILGIAS
jgi:hypothetical protein